MNKQIAKELHQFSKTIAQRFSYKDREGNINNETFIAIGPDRGFNKFEVEQFEKLNFKTVSIGPRILHQESAIPFILGRFL